MKSELAIIGGGPSALLLAAHIDPSLYRVTIYEQQKTVGRKFLVAGKGGFNLTHGGNITDFINQYHPSDFLKSAIERFTPDDLRDWLAQRGVNTYVGSSGRVFPLKDIKPIKVLQAILDYLETLGVIIKYNEKWTGWDNQGSLTFDSGLIVKPSQTILALGGGSWKITGSDGHWLSLLQGKGVQAIPFKPVNCGFTVNWDGQFLKRYAGQPIKNIKVKLDKIESTGELKITDYGLEGNAIYAISYCLQSKLNQSDTTQFTVDLKPMLTEQSIREKLETSPHSVSQTLSKVIKLSKVKIALLKSFVNKEDYINPENLACKIKGLSICVTSPRSLDEAISTIGGISQDALTKDYQLKAIPNTYCIGEMVDWFAPTGGYLLQGCFSMGVYLAQRLNQLD